MTAISRGCRIGKIRLKSGGELKLLPNARQASTDETFEKFHEVCGWTKDLYAEDFDGFALVVWTRSGDFNAFVRSGRAVHPNLLPQFVAEAVRRDNGDRDMQDLLNRTLSYDG